MHTINVKWTKLFRQGFPHGMAGSLPRYIRCAITDYTVANKLSPQALADGLPRTHPFAIAPAIGSEQCNSLPAQFGFTASKHGRKNILLQLLHPHGGTAKSTASKESIRSVPNSDAGSSSTKAPASCAPAATALAMASVFPVPLQYTTAILLIVAYPQSKIF